MPSKLRKPAKDRKPRPSKDDENLALNDDDGEPSVTQGVNVANKPSDQLKLTEEELKEEITKILSTANPNAADNIIRFNYKEMTYKPIPTVDQLAIHYSVDGNLIDKDSEEGQKQLATIKATEVVAEKEEGGETTDKSDANKKLTNQFNFSERASQTYNNPNRDRGTMTEPPPRADYSGNATQWEIYDSYIENNEQKSKVKEKIGRRNAGDDKKRKNLNTENTESSNDDVHQWMQSLKILERMINQNTYDELAQDFKYWEDTSDELKDQQGSLLPLWRFSYDKVKKMCVTELCWNFYHTDMFAVGLGSYNFLKQREGLLLIYTLKNPTFPEFVFPCDSGVMCFDFHSTHANLLCAGFYDGTVAMYNLAKDRSKYIFRSSAKDGKHTDPVWQIKWQTDDLDNTMSFYSISSDGRVVCWKITKSGLEYLDMIRLNMQVEVEGLMTSSLNETGAGISFSFHKSIDWLYLVGTEEGILHKCSKSYNHEYLDSFQAHHMLIYNIEWNTFHPDIYITCSADWTVKIWDQNNKVPLFTYDLGSSVGDVAWAPYSSTVFAAVTTEGKVFIYDLNVNKYEPLCEQIVTTKKKAKLTHVKFNRFDPIIIVGDDRGEVSTFKLSPNLHKMPKVKKGQDQLLGPEYETGKLDKLLAAVRDVKITEN
ncbi:hypothetical protein SNEBB_009357 [Seison nebaliae]|nr:hypothetical protein SNEBB_009357 [Seison nebaliae]